MYILNKNLLFKFVALCLVQASWLGCQSAQMAGNSVRRGNVATSTGGNAGLESNLAPKENTGENQDGSGGNSTDGMNGDNAQVPKVGGDVNNTTNGTVSSGDSQSTQTLSSSHEDPNKDSTKNPVNDSDKGLPITDQFTVEGLQKSKPIDVFFAIDTSGSMKEEKDKVAANMGVLTSTFAKAGSSVDYHLWIIARDVTITGGDVTKITHIDSSIGSHDSLEVMQNFFMGNPASPFAIRNDSFKAMVVVSDDNARGVLAADFKTYLVGDVRFKGKSSFNGFVWIPNQSVKSATCSGAGDGLEYIALAKDKDVGGTIFDLCANDWTPLFTTLGKKILSQTVVLQYKLSKVPDMSVPIRVSVDGNFLDLSSYTFDPVTNSLVFGVGMAPELGKKILVSYKSK